MIKVISFDLDGTLADEKFDDHIWWEEIPRMYAEKHKLTFKEAQDKIFSDYYRAEWVEKLKWNEWTNLEYWINKYKLGNWKELIERAKEKINIYEDVEPTLKKLSKNHKLIIISNSAPKFLETKLAVLNIKKYFHKIYSCPQQFGIRKSKPVFQKILEELQLKPENMMHVGDNHDADYLIPTELGITAYHLIRGRKRKEKHEINTLTELP